MGCYGQNWGEAGVVLCEMSRWVQARSADVFFWVFVIGGLLALIALIRLFFK